MKCFFLLLFCCFFFFWIIFLYLFLLSSLLLLSGHSENNIREKSNKTKQKEIGRMFQEVVLWRCGVVMASMMGAKMDMERKRKMNERILKEGKNNIFIYRKESVIVWAHRLLDCLAVQRDEVETRRSVAWRAVAKLGHWRAPETQPPSPPPSCAASDVEDDCGLTWDDLVEERHLQLRVEDSPSTKTRKKTIKKRNL